MNARELDQYFVGCLLECANDYQRHVVLIRWQTGMSQYDTPLVAWSEGPKGYCRRLEQGIPGYEGLIESVKQYSPAWNERSQK